MYKLVILSGPKNESYELDEGEYVFGRGKDADIRLEGKGVSKRHCKIVVSKREIILSDIGSSNGTFVNGSMARTKRLRLGDRVSIGNFILELRKSPAANRKIRKIDDIRPEREPLTGGTQEIGFDGNLALSGGTKSLAIGALSGKTSQIVGINQSADMSALGEPLHQENLSEEEMKIEEKAPKDLVERLKWILQKKILPKLYGLNQEHEWRLMLLAVFGVYILVNIFFTIPGILDTNKEILMREVGNRGIHYARDMSVVAKEMLSTGKYSQLDSDFLEQEEGYKDFEIVDMDGKIFAPVERQGEWTSNAFTSKSLNSIKKAYQRGKPFKHIASWIGNNEIGIAQPVSVFLPSRGVERPVGMVVIRFAPGSLNVEDSNVSQIYINTIITALLIGGILLFFIYKMTLKPIDELSDQMDLVLKGAQDRIELKQKMSELDPLVGVVSSSLKQLVTLRERSANGGQMDVFEETPDMVMEKYRFVSQNSSNPFLILDSEYSILNANDECDEVLGIRELDSLGQPIFEATHDETFSSSVVDLCEKASMTPGEGISDDLDIAGVDYRISVAAAVNKDSEVSVYLVMLNLANG